MYFNLLFSFPVRYVVVIGFSHSTTTYPSCSLILNACEWVLSCECFCFLHTGAIPWAGTPDENWHNHYVVPFKICCTGAWGIFFFTSICLLHNVVVILSCNWIVAGSSHDYRKSFSACSLKNRKNGKRSFTLTYLCFQIKKWKTSFSKFRTDLKTILSFHYLLFLTKVLFSKWKQQFLLIKIVS